MPRFLFSLLLVCAPMAAQAVGLFHIELNPGAGLAANPAALAAFERAAAEWEAWISSPVTIYVDVDLSPEDGGGNPFDPNTIGAASFTLYTSDGSDINLDYGTVRNAMAARATQPGLEILAHLPTSEQVSARTPSGGELDITTIGLVRANQRALGLLDATDTRADGIITFNSAFTFDYDRFDADGVAPGKIDFQTAAAHEIGHTLGFLSDVDDFDRIPGLESTNLTTLDFFRFPLLQRPTTFSEFTTFARTLRPGEESVFTDLNVSYAFSTGANMGDGNQASHWKDDFLNIGGVTTIGSVIGIMDPTLNSGQFWEVGSADLRAMQVIGYDIIPEPQLAGLLVAGALALTSWRRRGSR